MGVIDPNAMYRAGFARGTKGRNPEVERRVARQEKLINFAYETVGNVAVEAVQDGFKSFQKFRDQLESPMAASLTKIEKLPRENAEMAATIKMISDNYRKANRVAHTSFGKKRRAARAERQKWMTQMTDINAFFETHKGNAEEAQGFARVAVGAAGVDNKAGNVNLNPGNQGFENQNTAELASGELSQLLRWNTDGGYMEVTRNGKWTKDAAGKDVYVDKGLENNKELKKEYEAFAKDKPEGFTMPNYQQWAKQNYPEATTLRTKRYSDLRFGKGEDSQMEKFLQKVKGDMITGAKGENALSWEEVEEKGKTSFVGEINDYKDSTFRDFYFGGYSFDYSSGRMDESAPAYQELISRGLEQGTPAWEGALTTLKAQSMVKGSVFRQSVAEDQWNLMKDQYTKSKTGWETKQAENERKAAGRGNSYKPFANYTVDGYTGNNLETATQQYKNMLEVGKVNYNKSGNTKYVANEGGTTTISLQDVTPGSKTYGQFTEVETISTNDALARRGLDIFGGGYVEKASSETSSTDVKEDLFVPKSENTEQAKQRQGIITTLQGAYPKGYMGRSFESMDIEELQRILDGFKSSVKSDVRPTPKFLQKQ